MSGGYALIPRSLFAEAWFQKLSDRGSRLALYAAAGPHSNIIGAFLLPDGYISADLGWSLETVTETVSELVAVGFVKRFGSGRYLLLCRHGEWNTIKNPNVMKAALKQLEALPPDAALSDCFQWLSREAKRLGKGLPNNLETIRQRFGIEFRNTEASTEASTSSETEIENGRRGEERVHEVGIEAPWLARLREACGTNFESLVRDIGGAITLGAWFADCSIERGPPTIIVTSSAMKAEKISQKFMRPLRAALGADVVVMHHDNAGKVAA